jgi:two-component sensor histidine kinase
MADVAQRVVRMLEGSLGREDVHIDLHTASVQVDAAVATPLAVILNELIQNAIEHGLGDGPGAVTVELRGGGDQPVELQVHDDGGARSPERPGRAPGPPEGERSRPPSGVLAGVPSPGILSPGILSPGGGLGLRLVRALVEEELNGRFTLAHPAGRGSIATAVIPPVERAG